MILDVGDLAAQIFSSKSSPGRLGSVEMTAQLLSLITYDRSSFVNGTSIGLHTHQISPSLIGPYKLVLFESIHAAEDYEMFNLEVVVCPNPLAATLSNSEAVPTFTKHLFSSHILGEDLADVCFAVYSMRCYSKEQEGCNPQLCLGRPHSAYGDARLLTSRSGYITARTFHL